MKRSMVIVSVLLLVGLAIGATIVLTSDRAGDRSVRWLLVDEPDTTATELIVHVFVGDGCNEFKTISVDESDEQVRVTAVVHDSGAADCNALMQTREETVRLAAPLGEREIVGCKSRDGELCSDAPAPE